MRKLMTTGLLAASLALGGCQYPDGSLDVGNTLLLGAGAAAVTGLAISASQPSYYHTGYGRGWGHRPHGGWRGHHGGWGHHHGWRGHHGGGWRHHHHHGWRRW